MEKIKQRQRDYSNRIWELDALRGFLILLVVFDHLAWDLGWSGIDFQSKTGQWLARVSDLYLGGVLRTATHTAFVVLFVAISGVCCCLSRNNLRRGLRMGLFAVTLTVVTVVADSILPGDIAIYFGIIHCIAVCQILYGLLERIRCPKTVLFVLAVAALVVGAYYQEAPLGMDVTWQYPFVSNWLGHKESGDFWPLLPFLGWFLVGALLGKVIYKEGKSVVNVPYEPGLRWLQFAGRHSLAFYFGGQIVGFGLIFVLVTWCGF